MPLCVETKPSMTPPPAGGCARARGGRDQQQATNSAQMNLNRGTTRSHCGPSPAGDQFDTATERQRDGAAGRDVDDVVIAADDARDTDRRRRARATAGRSTGSAPITASATASDPAAWPLGKRVHANRQVLDHLRGEAMDRRIGELRLALERPRRTRLDQGERRKRRELRRPSPSSSSDRRAGDGR